MKWLSLLLSDLLEHKSSVRAHDAGRCRLRFSFFSGYIDRVGGLWAAGPVDWGL